MCRSAATAAFYSLRMKKKKWEHDARSTNSFVEFRFPNFLHFRSLSSSATSRTTEKNIYFSIVNGSTERLPITVRHWLRMLPHSMRPMRKFWAVLMNTTINSMILSYFIFLSVKIHFDCAKWMLACNVRALCSKLLLLLVVREYSFFFSIWYFHVLFCLERRAISRMWCVVSYVSFAFNFAI